MFIGHLCIFFGEMFFQFLLPLSQSAQAAITKQTAWLKPQNSFLPIMEHGSQISGCHHGQSGSFPGLQVAFILVYAYQPLIIYILYKYFLLSCRWSVQSFPLFPSVPLVSLCVFCCTEVLRLMQSHLSIFTLLLLLHLVSDLRNRC